MIEKSHHPSPAARITRRLPPAAWPAALAMLCCLGATAFIAVKPASIDARTLQKSAKHAAGNGDYRSALLRYQQLLALEPQVPEHAYQIAHVLDQLHQRSDAMQVLATIAPLSGGGYGPAHLQQAEWLIEARVVGKRGDPAHMEQARTHLSQTFADEPTRRQAKALRFALDATGSRPIDDRRVDDHGSQR